MNNPPAFPTNQYANGISPSGFDTGMTLRDYFAANVLQGELSSQSSDVGEWTEKTYPDLARRCYALADAMLAAREEGGA